MKSLYLRIRLTVVAALALFALVSGWMWQHHVEQERVRLEAAASDRLAAWAELVQRALPSVDAPAAEQAEALREWSARLRVPLALDDRRGVRIGASDSFLRRAGDGVPQAAAVRLDDGRTLWLARRLLRRAAPEGASPDELLAWRGGASGPFSLRQPRGPMLGDHTPGPALGERPGGAGMGPPPMAFLPGQPNWTFGLPQAVGPLILVALLFVAVAAGAYPVVRRLTRRLEALKQGVEAFGGGNLAQRVDDSGRDEVAAVATTFNLAAGRIETLVRSHQTLLANASHELRSPLARLKMAVALYAEMPESQRAGLRREIDTNVAELDALVEEVLLASRLDGNPALDQDEPFDLLGVAAEESARVGAEVEVLGDVATATATTLPSRNSTTASSTAAAITTASPGDSAPVRVPGSERLVRRALRNLLENARRYGGGQISAEVARAPGAMVQVRVCDRGAGVPEALRERIFEPFFRLPGHTEREGGVGLGLSLVRQIAQRHGGTVHCEARPGGGSCFVLSLPALPQLQAQAQTPGRS